MSRTLTEANKNTPDTDEQAGTNDTDTPGICTPPRPAQIMDSVTRLMTSHDTDTYPPALQIHSACKSFQVPRDVVDHLQWVWAEFKGQPVRVNTRDECHSIWAHARQRIKRRSKGVNPIASSSVKFCRKRTLYTQHGYLLQVCFGVG